MKATFMRTKAGKGYKLCIDDTWLFVNAQYLDAVLAGERSSCYFAPIEGNQPAAPEEDY